MIKSKADLKEYLKTEKKNAYPYGSGIKYKLLVRISMEHYFEIWKYIKYLRKSEYYMNTNKNKNIIRYIKYLFYERKKNKLGNKIGFYIPPNTFEKGLFIAHHGSIIINPMVHVGQNCILHGDVCIGNNGEDNGAPQIGNNVDIGIGAKILGDIKIGNNIKIGANAVVVKSFINDGDTIIGIPGKLLGGK